ncbi:Zn-ribbon domain-containing OB-fold protein [Rhodococcus sp. IEGM1428]|uniref:Zn-ribbon domain-containing OB-fold protein n=1 Tax=Rhodococcus sp. IEGM1428 TaxID=3392191 RepID=UPI003D0C8FA5
MTIEPRPVRPLPSPTPTSQKFWDAIARHELIIQLCTECAVYRHYPQPRCPQCGSGSWEWSRVSGRGIVYSYTITHQPFHPAWADRTPYAVVTVDLEEGVRMVGELPPEDTDRVSIGMPVRISFLDLPDGRGTIPTFRLS